MTIFAARAMPEKMRLTPGEATPRTRQSRQRRRGFDVQEGLDALELGAGHGDLAVAVQLGQGAGGGTPWRGGTGRGSGRRSGRASTRPARSARTWGSGAGTTRTPRRPGGTSAGRRAGWRRRAGPGGRAPAAGRGSSARRTGPRRRGTSWASSASAIAPRTSMIRPSAGPAAAPRAPPVANGDGPPGAHAGPPAAGAAAPGGAGDRYGFHPPLTASRYCRRRFHCWTSASTSNWSRGSRCAQSIAKHDAAAESRPAEVRDVRHHRRRQVSADRSYAKKSTIPEARHARTCR